MSNQEQLERATRIAIISLAVIAAFVALKLAENVFAPILFALTIGAVLSPVSDFWEKIGFPSVLGALISMGFGLTGLAVLTLLLEPFVSDAIDQAPRILEEMQQTIGSLQQMLRGLDDITADVTEAIAPDGNGNGAEDAVAVPTITDALLFAPTLAAQVMIFAGTLFFFLLSRNEIYVWLSEHVGARSAAEDIASRLKNAERLVSRYFLTIAMINLGFGALVALALYSIGMPSPVLWGVFAAGMNFILYIGPAFVAACLLVGGVVVFSGPMSIAPMAIFVGLNLIEGQFVTPGLVGKRMAVNPLLVFLSLVFWLWLWGPVGGIVAIPILIWLLALRAGKKRRHTISSGTPGKDVPNRSAGAAS